MLLDIGALILFIITAIVVPFSMSAIIVVSEDEGVDSSTV
jgi:multisubunit Na+/H+ antiporter MnhC subunit